MALELWWIGKKDKDEFGVLYKHYLDRIQRYIPVKSLLIPESKESLPQNKVKAESKLILSRINPGDQLTLLDEKGKSMDTRTFSKFIETQLHTGKSIFLIGGAYGFHDDVYKRSNKMISLSHFTMPHKLARVVLCEQIYRGLSILNNSKYHHE